MNKNISFIYDLDGTLLDSYDVILSGIQAVCDKYGFPYDEKEIRKEIITYSVNHFLERIGREHNIPFETMKNGCSLVTRSNVDKIKVMRHAKELLEELHRRGVKNYVFTHRGVTTEKVLRNVGLYDYFIEIITSQSGFKRKPEPDALLYLVDKYHLNPNDTYYVGDRSIDIEAAYNANIKSILYLNEDNCTVPSGKETYIVKDLLEILNIR